MSYLHWGTSLKRYMMKLFSLRLNSTRYTNGLGRHMFEELYYTIKLLEEI
jgi:hypothetical protein